MSRREEQAYNDGRLAYRERKGFEACTRRSATQRAAWLDGYEHERRLDLAETVTDEQRVEAHNVVRRLREFAEGL